MNGELDAALERARSYAELLGTSPPGGAGAQLRAQLAVASHARAQRTTTVAQELAAALEALPAELSEARRALDLRLAALLEVPRHRFSPSAELAVAVAMDAVVERQLARFDRTVAQGDRQNLRVPTPLAEPAVLLAHQSEVPPVTIHADWAGLNGLASAARRLAVGLVEAGVDVRLADFTAGAPQVEALVPEVLRGRSREAGTGIHLWTANIGEFHLVSDDDLHPGGAPRFNIAAWYWELSVLPAWMHHHFTRVDELWAPTTSIRRAFLRHHHGEVPVLPPPLPELVPSAPLAELRRDRAIPDGEMVVLFTFSAGSGVARKNPFGAVKAFADAFGARGGARLIVKVSDLGDVAHTREPLAAAIAAVGGQLIEDRLSDQEMVDLVACCDVYLSLHRSEGLGLGMAEAMSLGKVVVATAYSGNLDFMDETTACLVGYRPRPITTEELATNETMENVYLPGTLWAEPNVAHASAWLTRLAANPLERAAIGHRAQVGVRTRLGARRSTNAMVGRLEALGRRHPWTLEGRHGQ